MGSEHTIRYQYMPDASWQGSLDQMKQILAATEPGKVSAAGQAYSAAADKFSDTAELLRRELPKLREAWTGKVAEEAIGKLEKLLRQADTMHTTSSNIGASLTDHGEKLKWYAATENQPGPGMFDSVDWGDVKAFAFGGLVGLGAKNLFMQDAEDKAATEFMTRLSGRTLEANNMMPASVSADIPAFGNLSDFDPNPPVGGPGAGSGPGGGGSNGGLPKFQDSMGDGGGGVGGPKAPSLPNGDPYGSGGPGSGSGGAGSGNPPYGSGGVGNPPNGIGGTGSDGGGIGSGSGGRLPSGIGGIGSDGGPSGLPSGIGNSDPFGSQGTRLAGATPNLPGGGLDGLGPGGGGAGGGVSGFGGGGGGVGGGSGLASNGLGPGGAMGAGAGAGGAGRGFGAGGATAGGTGRGAGMPMGGGGGGRGEEERERSTWLTEDEDVWGGDADTAPPVIG